MTCCVFVTSPALPARSRGRRWTQSRDLGASEASCSRCLARRAAGSRRRFAARRARPDEARSRSADARCSRPAAGRCARERARPRDGLSVVRDLAAHGRVRQRGLPAVRAAAAPSALGPRAQGPGGARPYRRAARPRSASTLPPIFGRRAAAAHSRVRALVAEPPLLLLDEPLSNLDARLQDEMRFELKRLQHELSHGALRDPRSGRGARDLERRRSDARGAARAGRDAARDLTGCVTLRRRLIGGGECSTASSKTCTRRVRRARRRPGSCGRTQAESPRGQHVALVVRPEHVRLSPAARASAGR